MLVAALSAVYFVWRRAQRTAIGQQSNSGRVRFIVQQVQRRSQSRLQTRLYSREDVYGKMQPKDWGLAQVTGSR